MAERNARGFGRGEHVGGGREFIVARRVQFPAVARELALGCVACTCYRGVRTRSDFARATIGCIKLYRYKFSYI